MSWKQPFGWGGSAYVEAEEKIRRNPPPLFSDIDHLKSAIEAVLIGGNHLVNIIGSNEILPYRYSAEKALEYYGAGPKYDAWCCWRSIIMLRDAKGILYGTSN